MPCEGWAAPLTDRRRPAGPSSASLPPSVHALVIGAGIAGSALALALRRAGHTVDLFESRPAAVPAAGGHLHVAPNGMRALHHLGVGERVGAEGVHVAEVRYLNAAGREVGVEERGRERERFGSEGRVVRRSTIRRALVEAAEGAGADLLTGRRLAALSETVDEVRAVFQDGTVAVGDVLFGCDGARSDVRGLAFPEAPDPDVGVAHVGGSTPAAEVPDLNGSLAPGTQLTVLGRRASFEAVATLDGEVWWASVLPCRPGTDRGAPRATGRADWRRRLLTLHGEDPAPVADVIGAARDVWASPADLSVPPLSTWHTHRVCLVGDAAHAVPARSGQGASQALEDVLVLVRELSGTGPLGDAFERYERARKPRTKLVAAMAREEGGRLARGPIGAALRDLLFPLALRVSARRAARILAPPVETTP